MFGEKMEESHLDKADTPPPVEPVASDEPAASQPAAASRLIELGWIIAGPLDDADRQALEQARQDALAWLQETFPLFQWKMPLIERTEVVREARVEPVQLLDFGVTERNVRRWDFTVLVTSADLISHYKKDALAVVSRSLQAAVISTSRIDPRAYQPRVAVEERVRRMADRIRALLIHALGHLAGLEHDGGDEQSFLADFNTIDDIDRARKLATDQVEQWRHALQEVADSRLEERTDTRRVGTVKFYLGAAWINRRQIAKAIREARPWQFPFRLSRLTTAATSTVLILMITAETWELSLNQPGLLILLLALITIVLTTVFIVARQQLFIRRERARLSELSVVMNVSTLAVVAAGMTTTFVLLSGLSLLVGSVFFGPRLISKWVAETGSGPGFFSYLKLAAFVSAIGISIGALGATFESNYYFRHITFVDEEI